MTHVRHSSTQEVEVESEVQSSSLSLATKSVQGHPWLLMTFCQHLLSIKKKIVILSVFFLFSLNTGSAKYIHWNLWRDCFEMLEGDTFPSLVFVFFKHQHTDHDLIVQVNTIAKYLFTLWLWVFAVAPSDWFNKEMNDQYLDRKRLGRTLETEKTLPGTERKWEVKDGREETPRGRT